MESREHQSRCWHCASACGISRIFRFDPVLRWQNPQQVRSIQKLLNFSNLLTIRSLWLVFSLIPACSLVGFAQSSACVFPHLFYEEKRTASRNLWQSLRRASRSCWEEPRQAYKLLIDCPLCIMDPLNSFSCVFLRKHAWSLDLWGSSYSKRNNPNAWKDTLAAASDWSDMKRG